MIKAALESQFPTAALQDVPSAEEALVLLSQEHYDLLVVDIRLAGMSGLEMVAKARRRLPTLNIVVITGINDPVMDQHLEQAPIQAWFRKPLPMEDFLACVTRLLGEATTQLPPAPQTAEPLLESKKEKSTANAWNELVEQLGLFGLWVGDLQGDLTIHSTDFPPSLQLPRLREYFFQVENKLQKLQRDYEAEVFLPLAVYLKGEYVASLLRFEGVEIVFCIKKAQFPSQPLELQMALIQKAQELLEALKQNPSLITPSTSYETPAEKENIEMTAAPDTALEELLQNPSLILTQGEQADEFWEQSLVSEDWQDSTNQSQTLSSLQARQMGILSIDESEDSPKE